MVVCSTAGNSLTSEAAWSVNAHCLGRSDKKESIPGWKAVSRLFWVHDPTCNGFHSLLVSTAELLTNTFWNSCPQFCGQKGRISFKHLFKSSVCRTPVRTKLANQCGYSYIKQILDFTQIYFQKTQSLAAEIVMLLYLLKSVGQAAVLQENNWTQS